jgi:hypothetical protein
MLSYILRIMQEFERMHGRHPQVIYLNARHMRQLMHECPDLFNAHRPVPLGFRVVEVSEEELPHPKAAWLPAPEPKPRRKAEFAKASARSRASRRKTHAKKRR